MIEEDFLLFVAEHRSDLDEAVADITDRYDQLLERLQIDDDHPFIPLLRAFLFDGEEP